LIVAEPAKEPAKAPAPAERFDDATPHLLIVDDDRRLRALLQRYLGENGFRVTTASDAAEARGHLANLDFDLIVLDIMMPGESGLDLTASIRKGSEVPVLLLTARGAPEDRIAGLEHGADDYLPKPFEPRELVLRVQKIITRSRRAGAESASRIVRFGPCLFDPERGELTRNGAYVHLTQAEVQLLRLFASRARDTISRGDLCTLTGVPMERSVDVQITRLRRKIEANPRMPVYLQTVRGIGYTLMTD
jgi:two-component system, OmpR family, phosphate regulon response regulator OmpR